MRPHCRRVWRSRAVRRRTGWEAGEAPAGISRDPPGAPCVQVAAHRRSVGFERPALGRRRVERAHQQAPVRDAKARRAAAARRGDRRRGVSAGDALCLDRHRVRASVAGSCRGCAAGRRHRVGVGNANVAAAITRQPFLIGEDLPWVQQQRAMLGRAWRRALLVLSSVSTRNRELELGIQYAAEVLAADRSTRSPARR